MAYHTTANGEIYVEQNGIDVLLFPDTAAAILNDKTARIAALESALCEIEQNAGQCATIEQANWFIERIKQRAAAALK